MSYSLLVLDASTLILAVKVEVLPLIVGRIPTVITPQVAAEGTRQRERWDAKAIQQLIDDRRITIVRAQPVLAHRLAEDFRMAGGEASTLALAKVRDAIAGTDDGVAIKACKVLGIPFVTAVHLLLGAYEQRLIDRQAALVRLEQLQKFGRYHPRILEDAMAQLI